VKQLLRALSITLLAILATRTPAVAAPPAPADDAAVKKALDDEMARSLAKLRLGSDGPPYFLRYAVVDTDESFFSARLGALVTVEPARPSRKLAVELRVGSPDEDNTNFLGSSPGATANVTRDDHYAVLRRDLWQMTDRLYKHALEAFARKKASRAIQAAEKDKVPDFAKAPPLQLVTNQAAPLTDADRAKLKELVVKLSAVFREFPGVDSARVAGEAELWRRRLLTSEKTWTDERRSRVRIDVAAGTVAKDGQQIGAGLAFAASDVGGLPPFAKMEAEVRALAKNLTDQRSAPMVDAGSASVLFEGMAAPQLARILFAHSLSGQPIPRSPGDRMSHDGSMSFADKLGLLVAPKWLDVVDDPKALGPGKRKLFGGYDSDDEGVAAERTPLIERGVVKTLLMSRAPRKEIGKSNGHGRGFGNVRASAANLFVTASGGLSREQLLAAAARSAGPNGTVYIVRQLAPGSGGRGQLQARLAFRYKDGKEEIVRGLSLEGFVPKKLKKDLVAAGKDPVVLDEDHGAPTTVVSPALLFEDVDVGRPNDKNRTPPLYPSPLTLGAR
jgi:TldD protein